MDIEGQARGSGGGVSSAGRDRFALFEQFRSALIEAQGDRHLRQDIMEAQGGPEMGWVAHERAVMLRAVNVTRAHLGFDPVTEAAIARVEQMAAGHSDYTKKYALYCAEIALDEDPTARVRP